MVNAVALTITAVDKSKDYGAALPALLAIYSGFVNGDVPSFPTRRSSDLTLATASSHAGSYAITCSGAADNDYTRWEVGRVGKESRVALTMTAVDKSKDYGAALPALTASYSGFVEGDVAASLPTALACSTL